MLTRILAGLLALAMIGDGLLYGLLERQKARAEATIAQAAVDANTALTASLSHQATAYEARIAELMRRQEQSDAVTQAALARAENSEDNLRKFRSSAAGQKATDQDYARWADTPLPAGVNDRMHAL